MSVALNVAAFAVLAAFIAVAAAAQTIIVSMVKRMSERVVTVEESDSMFYLYFKVMEEIEEEIHQAGLHPGRGRAAFGIRTPNNPLPKINVCHFYKLSPPMFQTLCGLSPDEFDMLLLLVIAQMLRPRNGFCEYSDAQQAARKAQVHNFLTKSCCTFVTPITAAAPA